MKKIITIIISFLLIFDTTFIYAASVRIIGSGPGQTIKIFSSISDLNSNTNSIQTLTTDSNSEALYNYAANSTASVYLKAELSSSIDEGGISQYTLASGDSNIISLGVGGSLSALVNELDSIKGPGFIFGVHSLSSTSSGGISGSDKNDIANLVRQEVESPGSLLRQIFNLVMEVLTRVFSIKSDTLKIS